MKYFKILIFTALSIYSAIKGAERFSARDDDAGMFYYLAAISFGVPAIVFAIQLYQENNKKED
ncbi:MAG TPA: hypothetical protein DEO36_07025 [Flavobacteriaceae bacterium]|jgi:hypothetical protein|nr:hypothetical protein [Flavobacteriaceae bacterium]